jgi:hypothetical protein
MQQAIGAVNADQLTPPRQHGWVAVTVPVWIRLKTCPKNSNPSDRVSVCVCLCADDEEKQAKKKKEAEEAAAAAAKAAADGQPPASETAAAASTSAAAGAQEPAAAAAAAAEDSSKLQRTYSQETPRCVAGRAAVAAWSQAPMFSIRLSVLSLPCIPWGTVFESRKDSMLVFIHHILLSCMSLLIHTPLPLPARASFHSLRLLSLHAPPAVTQGW